MNDIEKAIETLRNTKVLCGFTVIKEWNAAIILAIEALGKQIPKKPAYTCDNEVIHCPNCDYDLMGGVELDEEHDPAYCWVCGQKLDWSGENDA
jgi:hypothetical protein